jgi:hypothetical protein
VLFGDRLPAADLLPTGSSTSVLEGIHFYAQLLVLAERIGVNVVVGV